MTPEEVLATYPDVPGYVYFAQDFGHTKIGCSRFPLNRIVSVASRNVTLVHLIASDDPFAVEKALHTRFADRHKTGEWFHLSSEDIQLIRRVSYVSDADAIPDFLRPLTDAATINKRKYDASFPVCVTGRSITIKLKPLLAKNMNKFLKSQRFRITKKSFIEAVIKDYLVSIGQWQDNP